MKFEIKKVESGMNCFYICLKNIYAQYSMTYSEEELYFLTNGFAYDFLYNEERAGFYLPFQEIVASLNEDCFDVQYLDETEGTRYEASIDDVLDRGMALLLVDTGKLTYSDVYVKNPGRIHSIIIYKKNNENYEICDPKIRNEQGGITIFDGCVNKEEILASAISVFTFVPKEHKLERFSERVVDVKAVLQNNLNMYLNNISHGNSLKGINGLEKFIEYCEKNCKDKEIDLECYEHIHFEIKIAVMENLYYLGSLLSKVENENIVQKKVGIEELEKGWEKIAHSFLKIIGSRNLEPVDQDSLVG